MILLLGPLLIVWLICGIWLACWCGISYRHKTGSFCQGMLASALVFLMCFGNEIYAYSKWKVMCYAGAGLHVYETQAVKGFEMKYAFHSDVRFYLENGYEFLEGMNAGYGGRELYIYKLELGRITESVNPRRVSDYKLITNIDNSLLVNKEVIEVVRLKDGFRMGELNDYGYKSGYVFQILRSLLEGDAVQGQAKWCENSIKITDLVYSAIPPIK